MDGLLGMLLALLGWVAFGLQAASAAKKRRREAAQGAGPPPPPSAVRGERPQSPKQSLAAARRRLERAAGLPADTLPGALSDELGDALTELRSLEARRSPSEAFAPEARLEANALLARARVLEALALQHASPVDGPWLRGAERAVAETLPEIAGRVVVTRHENEARGDAELAGSELIVLSLSPQAGHRPWLAAELVEEAWTHLVTDDPRVEAEARERAASTQGVDSAMDRFAAALVVAWAPALLVDAACTRSLGSGHVERLRRRLRETPPEAAHVVRLDAQRRVDALPPVALRLRLVEELHATLGPGRGSGPPPPPGGLLHLRGPGVWDQVALEPVREAAARALESLSDSLAGRAGLDDTSGLDERSRRLLESPPRRARDEVDGRTLLSALGRSAASVESAAVARRWMETWFGDAEAPARRTERPRGSRPPVSQETASSDSGSRARAVRQALLLGAAFGEPPR